MTGKVAGELEVIVESTARRLAGVADSAAAERPAPGKWSAKEIVGHLIDSAANNHHRFIRAQEVDVLSFPRYEQDGWVASQAYNERPWLRLIELWRAYNQHIAHVMRNIPPERLGTTCRIGDDDPVTLAFLVTDYVDHMNHHLAQIDRQTGSGR